MRSFIAALVAALSLSAPLAASAQTPSYAEDATGGDAQIRGRIVSFDGAYSLQVRDDRGYIDSVELHQGTIINPTGLTLESGMVVSVLGYNSGSYFAANEVDTPYTYYSGVPYYVGHPWNYYGPAVSLGFFFGNGGWWHGPAFVGPYHYYGGVRVYNNVQVNAFYRGGAFEGRAYAAPVYRGGYFPGGDRGDYRGGDRGDYHGGGRGDYHGGDRGDYHGGDRGDFHGGEGGGRDHR